MTASGTLAADEQLARVFGPDWQRLTYGKLRSGPLPPSSRPALLPRLG
jgi:hypothetical protein